MQHLSVNAAAGDSLIPVFIDRNASEKGQAQCNDRQETQPDNDPLEKLPSSLCFEYAAILEHQRELDYHGREIIRDNVRIQSPKEVFDAIRVDWISEAVSNL